mgnify:CR=1 FL=1
MKIQTQKGEEVKGEEFEWKKKKKKSHHERKKKKIERKSLRVGD